ncbi:hypothetical protein L873DRAFT_1794326 [Choiromyces venosus 120613-1]|uniref:Uncharacterized protein n=1 Tax=Choiromyces venosus 120613-1 TaxID=1336337 RepID=A0A3N4J4Y6_9PEZI|nr:hypothetical protein L873DRAFT_1794326 [Choiromyces venosus 120613-1]
MTACAYWVRGIDLFLSTITSSSSSPHFPDSSSAFNCYQERPAQDEAATDADYQAYGLEKGVLSSEEGEGDGVLRVVSDEAERIVRAQGVAEEELGGGARVARIEAAVRDLVEAGVVSVEKKVGGGG